MRLEILVCHASMLPLVRLTPNLQLLHVDFERCASEEMPDLDSFNLKKHTPALQQLGIAADSSAAGDWVQTMRAFELPPSLTVRDWLVLLVVSAAGSLPFGSTQACICASDAGLWLAHIGRAQPSVPSLYACHLQAWSLWLS